MEEILLFQTWCCLDPNQKSRKIQHQSKREVIQSKLDPVKRVEESAELMISIGAQGKWLQEWDSPHFQRVCDFWAEILILFRIVTNCYTVIQSN